MHRMLILLIAMLPGLAAQTPAESAFDTAIERFLARKEVLKEQISMPIGSVKTSHPRREESLTIEGVMIRDFVSQRTLVNGIQIAVPSGQGYYVDENEIEPLVRALQAMETQAVSENTTRPGITRSLSFTTRSGFSVSCRPGTGGGSAGGKGAAYSPMSAAALGELRRLLEQAKSWLLAQ